MPLWPSARRELRHVRSLLPLFVVFADADWRGEIAASDASGRGCGVCRRRCDREAVAEIGRAAERWRCLPEELARVCDHALGSGSFGAALRDPGCLPTDEAKNWRKSFGE
eukprot:7707749-Pyramimonas_sp.AAC.1